MTGPLAALLRRLAASSVVGEVVVRGGLLTRLWAGPSRRVTRDFDLLGLFAGGMVEGRRRVAEFLSAPVEDGMRVDVASLRGEVIWAETAHPGLRFFVSVAGAEVQIDIGFGDPLEPPAVWLDYPLEGSPARVLAARPELMAAWKLDGILELGVRRWGAKSLFDLWLLTECCNLDPEVLERAARVAFAAVGRDLGKVLALLRDEAFWRSELARRRWEKFRSAAEMPVPEDVASVAAEVAARVFTSEPSLA